MSTIRSKREAAGLTITELAARAQMSLSKVSRLENGILELKVRDLRVLARVLGCEPGELIPDIENGSAPANGHHP